MLLGLGLKRRWYGHTRRHRQAVLILWKKFWATGSGTVKLSSIGWLSQIFDLDVFEGFGFCGVFRLCFG